MAWEVAIRKMPALTSIGRYGRRVDHVVLLSAKGVMMANTQILGRTDVEAVKAKYQKIADAHNEAGR